MMKLPFPASFAASFLGAVACFGAVASAQDSLQLADGRFVSGPRMTRTPHGVVVHCGAGDILVPKDQVKFASVSAREEGMADDTSAEDKAKIAKGLVEFEGRWIRTQQRDAELAKRTQAMAKRIEETIKHNKWSDRYQKDSRYFAFEYTMDPEIMKYWSDLMDGYYSTFTSYWGIRPPAGHKKLSVKFYHDENYYVQVTGAAGTGGYFRFVPPIDLNFYYDRLDLDWTLNVMFHECNHYLVWLIAPQYKYPTWVSEGMAEYYGASVWDEKTKKLEVGGLLEGRLANVQQDILEGEWIGLEQLMAIPHAQFGGQYYGWAWTLVHFFMHTGYEKRFRQFFLGLPRDQGLKRERFAPDGLYQMTQHPADQVAIALKRDLRVSDLKALETEWHGYIKNLKPSSGKGYFSFGRTALMNGMPIKAKRMLEVAIEKGYDAPMVYFYYARALQQVPAKDSAELLVNLREAVKQYDKMLSVDPVNPLFRATYARLLNRIAQHERKADPNVEVQLKLAKELGDVVNGGAQSYEVFLETSWTPYAGEGGGN